MLFGQQAHDSLRNHRWCSRVPFFSVAVFTVSCLRGWIFGPAKALVRWIPFSTHVPTRKRRWTPADAADATKSTPTSTRSADVIRADETNA